MSREEALGRVMNELAAEDKSSESQAMTVSQAPTEPGTVDKVKGFFAPKAPVAGKKKDFWE